MAANRRGGRMTSRSDSELAREQRYVAGLYERLDALRAETADQLERTRRAGASGTHQARSERDAMARLFEDRLKQLRDVDERLAFGRLQTDEGALRYIGRIGLRDDDQQPLLLDWRGPPGRALFHAPPAAPPRGEGRRAPPPRGRG